MQTVLLKISMTLNQYKSPFATIICKYNKQTKQELGKSYFSVGHKLL